MAVRNWNFLLSRQNILLFSGWAIATVLIQLSMTLIVKASISGAWTNIAEFIRVLPFCLAAFELPAAYGTFYLLTGGHKRSFKPALFWVLPYLLFGLVIVFPLSGIFVYFGILFTTPTGSLLVLQIIVGWLQGNLLKPFIEKPQRWIKIRAGAFLVANVIILLALRQWSLMGDLWEYPTLMAIAGLFAGVIKGGGVIWLLQDRKSNPVPSTT